MVSQHSLAVAERAKRLYDERLRAELEARCRDQFVAIEPESGDYFVRSTYSESVSAARQTHPDRISFVMRVGHAAAIHLGEMTA
jgi:hypothetical protein